MKSRASVKSHPIHPMLVSFPIAFFTGTLAFDIIAQITGDKTYWLTGGYLATAGILFAILAATAGFIDFRYTVPPNSTAKKRAAKHGILNSIVLVVFIIALILRTRDVVIEPLLIILLELAGVVTMSVASWMGGTLVHRNQVGVDIRYADAGKWNELYVKDPGREIEVADVDELKPNQMKLVHVLDKRIVVARTEDRFVAFDDRCPHRGGSLAGGAMICGTVQCPWHGSQFDVKTGEVKAGPGNTGIQTYPVFVNAHKVFVRLQ